MIYLLFFFQNFFQIFQISDPPSGKIMWVPTPIFLDSDSVYPKLPTFSLETKKNNLFFYYVFLGYLGPKTHFNHSFFLLFFRNFFEISRFQTPLAAKLCESSSQFFLILIQCIPYYQSGMVLMSRGRVDDDLWWWKNRISKRIEPPKKWNFQISDPPSGKTMWVPTPIFLDSDSVYPILPIWHGLNVQGPCWWWWWWKLNF